MVKREKLPVHDLLLHTLCLEFGMTVEIGQDVKFRAARLISALFYITIR